MIPLPVVICGSGIPGMGRTACHMRRARSSCAATAVASWPTLAASSANACTENPGPPLPGSVVISAKNGAPAWRRSAGIAGLRRGQVDHRGQLRHPAGQRPGQEPAAEKVDGHERDAGAGEQAEQGPRPVTPDALLLIVGHGGPPIVQGASPYAVIIAPGGTAGREPAGAGVSPPSRPAAGGTTTIPWPVLNSAVWGRREPTWARRKLTRQTRRSTRNCWNWNSCSRRCARWPPTFPPCSPCWTTRRPGGAWAGGAMPFKRAGRNRYRSPSGRSYTGRQVRAYYATGGFARKVRRHRG